MGFLIFRISPDTLYVFGFYPGHGRLNSAAGLLLHTAPVPHRQGTPDETRRSALRGICSDPEGGTGAGHGLHGTHLGGLCGSQGPGGPGGNAGQGGNRLQRKHHQERQERGGAKHRRHEGPGGRSRCRRGGRGRFKKPGGDLRYPAG